MLTFEANEEDEDSDQEDVGRTLFKAAEQEVMVLIIRMIFRLL